MTSINKKFFVSGILITFILGSVFYPPTSHAQLGGALDCARQIFGIDVPTPGIGDLVGQEVPVKDKGVKKTLQQSACKKFADRLADLASQTALSVLKKRVLDSIVDQTINWINGGGDPKFITDFGGFLEDAGQAAVGDVAREIGLGELCTGISPVRIRLQLERPVFSQRVSCTLDRIVGNINRFRDNFTSGGWIGYQELLRPQNNRWGIEILTQSEVERRKAQKTDALRQEIAVGQGFLSTKQCFEWTRYGALLGGGTEILEVMPVTEEEGSNYPDPKNPPPLEPGGESNQEWICTQVKVSTPGQLLVGATQRAINAHTDYIINSDDLKVYAAAIIDAGINRLIKEGVKGLSGIFTNETSDGFSSESDFPEGLRNAGGSYIGAATEQELGSSRESLLDNLNEASGALEQAESNFTITITLLDQLISSNESFRDWCDTIAELTFTNRSLHPTTCANYTDATIDTLRDHATSTTAQINQGLGQINPLLNQIASLIPQIQNMSPGNTRSLTEEATALLGDATAVIEEAVNLLITTQGEIGETQTLLTTCQNPNLSVACP